MVILGAPCNQFGYQEYGNPQEILNILKYVRPGNGFEPKFSLLEKGDVNGEKAQPLFRFLRASRPIQDDRDIEADIEKPPSTFPILHNPITSSDVLWNFEKFLVNRSGEVAHRFTPAFPPENMAKTIETLLAEKVAAV